LKIVVCIKQVPDSAATLTAQDGRPDWGSAPLIINPWDEYAVETALLQQEAHGGEVIAISVGGESAREALKHALAMGCSQAVLITDTDLQQVDSQSIARTLAAAVVKIGDVDLALFGRQAIDTDTGITPAQAARVLGWPMLSLVSSILGLNMSGRTLKVERSTEEGRQIIHGRLPAVLSVGKDIGEPRFPSFMGIRKAQRADIPTWSLADLGLSAPQPLVSWPAVTAPEQRQVQTEMITGANPQEIAQKLVEKILSEKVL
jgi:electron transfer flavoprotein beta subunit